VLIDQRDARRALRAVHGRFYLATLPLAVGLVGPGLIGSTLLTQIHQQQAVRRPPPARVAAGRVRNNTEPIYTRSRSRLLLDRLPTRAAARRSCATSSTSTCACWALFRRSACCSLRRPSTWATGASASIGALIRVSRVHVAAYFCCTCVSLPGWRLRVAASFCSACACGARPMQAPCTCDAGDGCDCYQA